MGSRCNMSSTSNNFRTNSQTIIRHETEAKCYLGPSHLRTFQFPAKNKIMKTMQTPEAQAMLQPHNDPQSVHTSVGCRQLLRLRRRLPSSEDVRLQQRHLVVERWNFQPGRRFDAKRSTLCQQGSYCILLRFRCASTKITRSVILLYEVQKVWISVQN
jgi:hypothetical protein